MNLEVNVELKDDPLTKEQYKLNSIKRAICDVFAVRMDELLSPKRTAYIVTPRHVLYYLGYLYTPNSMPALGRRLGRDHTTILYGVHKIRKQRLKNKALNVKINEVRVLAESYDQEVEDGLKDLQKEIQTMVDRFKMEKIKNGLRTKA
jgi:chromosomal replication initiation ATPase DnaA